MKRIFSLLLCLALLFSITACKPDNITPPVEIIDPSAEEEETKKPEKTEPEEEEEQKETQPEKEEEQEKEEDPKPAPEEAEEEQEEQKEPSAEKETTAPTENPLAAKDFTPSNTVSSALSASGLVKKGTAVSALKNRTIVVYTADDLPAFSYTDAKGNPVTEWQWMKALAEENGFMLKHSIKNDAVAVKSQRIALFAGKKLSLIQAKASDLANALTLCRSALDYLNTDAKSFGISKAVLTQSNHALFAPVGNVNSLWYDPALLPENADPAKLAEENAWSVEEFANICNSVATNKEILPLLMKETLAWATLGGRSPLTLLQGKLDANINAGVTRNVWSVYKEKNLAAFSEIPEEGDYSLKNGNTAFHYTNKPEPAEESTLKYAPLPALEKGTAGTVTFTGTFFGLPKYEESEESALAALTFAELWCNRYTETRAAALQALGLTEKNYLNYCNMAEEQGVLILHNAAIEETVATYLKGLSDDAVNMDEAYANVKPRVDGLIAARNIYYELTA